MLTAELLERALADAGKCVSSDGKSPQALHAARSRAWVKCLGEQLRALCSEPDVRVFCKSDDCNREEFGLNELLYDVCVCRTETCSSARGTKTLRYVTKALWLVESEFARNSYEAVKDFNKLVIGAAENKLFVGPRLGEREEAQYLEALLPVARCSAEHGANVWLAMVAHPDAWGEAGVGVKLSRIDGDAWRTL